MPLQLLRQMQRHLTFFVGGLYEMPMEDRSGNSIPINSGENHEPDYIYSVPSVKVTENGYIDCGAYPEYNFAGNQPYTIEGWINPSASADLSVILAFEKDSQWQYYINYDKANSTIIAKRNSDGQGDPFLRTDH